MVVCIVPPSNLHLFIRLNCSFGITELMRAVSMSLRCNGQGLRNIGGRMIVGMSLSCINLYECF